MPVLKPNGKRVNGAGSQWIHPDVRYSIYIRDGFRCAYCNRDLRHVAARERTLDHIVPKVNGANHHPHNLLTACLRCNSKRQDTPFREWVASLERVRWADDGAWNAVGSGETSRLVHRLKMQARRKLPLALAREIRNSSKEDRG